MRAPTYLSSTLCILCLFQACSNVEKTNDHYNNETVIEIPKNKVKTIDFHDLFSKVTYVPLETTRESLIQAVDKLIYSDSLILVWDKRNFSILLFNSQGKFITRIKDQGKGPKEYVDVSDVSLDEEKKRIILSDPGKQSLFYFDFDGKFIEYRKIKDFGLSGPSFISFSNYLFFNRGNYPIDGKFLGVFSKERLTLNQSMIPFKLKSAFGGNDFIHSLNTNQDKLFYLAAFANEIHEIDSNLKVRKVYRLDFRGANPDYEELNKRAFNSIAEFDAYVFESGNILHTDNLVVTDDYFYFTYLSKNTAVQNVFYNRKSGKAKIATAVKGDADRYVWSSIGAGKGKNFIGIIDNPEYVFNLKVTHKMLPLSELQSNPILAFYTMNDALFE